MSLSLDCRTNNPRPTYDVDAYLIAIRAAALKFPQCVSGSAEVTEDAHYAPREFFVVFHVTPPT